MKVDQDVGVVAVDLLKGELRISGPEIESLAQFQSDPTCVQAARLFGSQTKWKKQKETFPCEKLID